MTSAIHANVGVEVPLCGLCGRPRRYIEKRNDFALYCAGQACTAAERPCRTCGAHFVVGSYGAKPRECGDCAKPRTSTTGAVSVIPKWSGRAVQEARKIVEASLPQPCGRCGDLVDGTESWAVGHILSRLTHPELTWEPSNWQVEHRACSDKSGTAAARDAAYREGFADGWVSALRQSAKPINSELAV